MSDTDEFEGEEVLGSAITLTNTGDGLSEAMEVAPVRLHIGEEVTMIVKGKVVDVAFPQKDGGVIRKHKVKAFKGVVVEGAHFIDDYFREQAEAKRKLDEEAAGQPGLGADEPGDDGAFG